MSENVNAKGKDTVQARVARSTWHLGLWTSAWLISYAAATLGADKVREVSMALLALVIIVNAGLGMGMILAVRAHALSLDEMWQKVYADANAITLGVAMVGGFSYILLHVTGLIPSLSMHWFLASVGLIYLAAVAYAGSRYR